MHDEGHDSGGQYVVLHEGIPGHPQALKEIEMDIVLGNLVELAPVGVHRIAAVGKGCGVPIGVLLSYFLLKSTQDTRTSLVFQCRAQAVSVAGNFQGLSPGEQRIGPVSLHIGLDKRKVGRAVDNTKKEFYECWDEEEGTRARITND